MHSEGPKESDFHMEILKMSVLLFRYPVRAAASWGRRQCRNELYYRDTLTKKLAVQIAQLKLEVHP